MNGVIVIATTMYFYTILHKQMWVNFGFGLPKCDTFYTIQELIWVLKCLGKRKVGVGVGVGVGVSRGRPMHFGA